MSRRSKRPGPASKRRWPTAKQKGIERAVQRLLSEMREATSPKHFRDDPGTGPAGGLFVGFCDGRPVYLTPRDRSRHVLVVGASGSGKSTFLEACLRQDIASKRGCGLIDPHGDLFRQAVAYLSYRRALDLSVPDVVLFDPSGNWVTPMNPFVRGPGDISTQVDRRVAATLRAWGQTDGDLTPRLEKWLKCIFTVLMEHHLTILEASYLVDRDSEAIRSRLTDGLSDPLIAAKLDQLSAYKPADFLTQMESVENRLMRFLCSDAVRRTMGVGTNALDYGAVMDSGAVVLVNLQTSDHLSDEQQRLLGTLLFGEFFEASMRRLPGSRPFYLYIDEAALFVTPELGKAFEQCRKRGLHLNLAFQHLSQFKAENFKVYKALKNNAGTKVVFAVLDREDATELADDLFRGLAVPEVKYVHTRLSHRIIDTREISTTRSLSETRSTGSTVSQSRGSGVTFGQSTSRSAGESESRESGRTRGQTASLSHSRERTSAKNWASSEQEGHGWSDSQSSGHAWSRGTTRAIGTTRTESGDMFDPIWTARSESRSDSSSASESETHSEGTATSYQQTSGSATSRGGTRSASRGRTYQKGTSASETVSHGVSPSRSTSQDESRSDTRSHTSGRAQSTESGRSQGYSETEQPGTRHLAFTERDPEFWSLEERRWQAAEKIMRQGIGSRLVSIGGGDILPVRVPLPRAFYIRPKQLAKLTDEFFARHSLPREEAEAVIRNRQASFLSQALAPPRMLAVTVRKNRAAAASSNQTDTTTAFDDLLGRE